MLLGILSDTHDELERTQAAVRLLREHGAEALVHCGDLSSPAIVAACSQVRCWFALGNHDADNVPALEEAARQNGAVCLGWGGEIELDGKLIAVAHGHMSSDIRRALARRPHYLFSGHSHIPSDRLEGLVRRINPGALSDADQFTVAILDLLMDELRLLTLPPT
jgi:putative phosphoesterase